MQTLKINQHHYYTYKSRRKSVKLPSIHVLLEDESIKLDWSKIAALAVLMILIFVLALMSMKAVRMQEAAIDDYQSAIREKELQIADLQSQLAEQTNQLNTYHLYVAELEVEVNTALEHLSEQINSTLNTLKN
ncbi:MULTISPECIES: hypothetical protein [unclassified Fusibacter]|uniref:hypothetical protein n=1 Tax=unclassified Fusibacter TaxID=2624464 RepID=UPI0010116BF5|nr:MULTISPECIES: hypothetical protein [unclassified Fusibacter]MCK8059114.1 hypothetical protein [Fusibacter sp. A2]NPE22523.1 hypothetical protein [Fusibacter sp. A1]RXV60626.1 hypothetical protein DWB64_11800 [Fusibacter sp. A1]